MKKVKFLTPVITAFKQDGELDCQANIDLWNHCLQGNIDGIVLLGSAGEFCSMRLNQRKQLAELAVQELLGKTQLIVGTGSMSAEETIAFSNHVLAIGADAVMVVGPYYFALNDKDIQRYYDFLADNIQGDIYLYNYPDRTGYDISPEIIRKLLKSHKNIVGYKDTSSNFSHTREVINAVKKENPNFMVYSGYDDNLARIALSGGSGCIGGLSNLYPEVFSAWVSAIHAGNLQEISEIQQLVDDMMKFYSMDNLFMPVVRRGLQIRGLSVSSVDAYPIGAVDSAQAEKIKAMIDDIDLAVKSLGCCKIIKSR